MTFLKTYWPQIAAGLLTAALVAGCAFLPKPTGKVTLPDGTEKRMTEAEIIAWVKVTHIEAESALAEIQATREAWGVIGSFALAVAESNPFLAQFAPLAVSMLGLLGAPMVKRKGKVEGQQEVAKELLPGWTQPGTPEEAKELIVKYDVPGVAIEV